MLEIIKTELHIRIRREWLDINMKKKERKNARIWKKKSEKRGNVRTISP